MINEETMTLKLTRIEVCDLLLATTICDINTDAEKWGALHDKLIQQLDEFDIEYLKTHKEVQ